MSVPVIHETDVVALNLGSAVELGGLAGRTPG